MSIHDESATSVEDLSYICGFSSFGDLEGSECGPTSSKPIPTSINICHSSHPKDDKTPDNENKLFNQFLQKSDADAHGSNDNSLNDSTLSLAKLEGLQCELDDNFLKSQTDEEGEQKLKEFLSVNISSGRHQLLEDNLHMDMDKLSLLMNESDHDSTMLRDVKARLGFTSINDTTVSYVEFGYNKSHQIQKCGREFNKLNDDTMFQSSWTEIQTDLNGEHQMELSSSRKPCTSLQSQVEFIPSNHNTVSGTANPCAGDKLSLTLEQNVNLDETPREDQESRLSSRYFLAASTPFLPGSIDQSTVLDSMNNSPVRDFDNERTIVNNANDATLVNNNMNIVATGSGQYVKRNLHPVRDLDHDGTFINNENNTTVVNTNANIVEVTGAGRDLSDWTKGNIQGAEMGDAIFGGCINGNAAEEGFEAMNDDFENMLKEDEKLVAESNDTIVKDQTGISEWSVCTANMHMNSDLAPSVNLTNSDGNVTRYFKHKSHDLGQSVGKKGNRPNFFDDTCSIMSPEKGEPNEDTPGLTSASQVNQIHATKYPLESCLSTDGSEPHASTSDEIMRRMTEHRSSITTRTSHEKNSLTKYSNNLQPQSSRNNSPKQKQIFNVGNDTVSIPVSEQEAEKLLSNIQQRRVSILGLENTKVESLAKTISLLTGTDVKVVYKILQIMAEEENPIPVLKKQENTDFVHTPNHTETFTCNTTVPDPYALSQDVVTPDMENSHLDTTEHFYHTLYPTVDSNSFSRGPLTVTSSGNSYKCAAVTPYQVNTNGAGNGGYEYLQSASADERHISASTESIPSHFGGSAFARSHVNLSDTIQYSHNVDFHVCCIGEKVTKIFKMFNSNSTWIQVHLHIVFSAFNGSENEDMRINPFTISPTKVVLGPNLSEEVKLKFLPKQAGSFMVKLELLVSPLVADDVRWQKLTKLVNIEGICEIPDLEVLLGENKCIDFGEVSYGSSCTRELKILNKGRADVPLKLSIFSNSSAVNFTFENSVTVSSSSDNPPAASTVVKGRDGGGSVIKPAVVVIKYHAPYCSPEYYNNQHPSAPEEHACQLDIKTDTEQILPISSLLVKAFVGFQRLHSLRSLQPIFFSCVEGTHCEETIPLRNAGNLLMNLTIKVCGASTFVLVSPPYLKLQPGEDSDLKILFKPDVVGYVEGVVKVAILPDGEKYEWMLKGTASQQILTRCRGNKPTLLCNTHALNWSGVPIGHSDENKLFLRNSSENESIHLSLSIASDHTNFQIVNNQKFVQKDVNKFEAVITPKGQLTVHVLFLPTYLRTANGSLVLRTLDGFNKFVIPLCGYGGKSQLDISGAKNLHNQFWIDMDEVYLGKKNIMNLMLRNSGSRSAFVSIKCFLDITARLEYPATHVCIMPNNFVLKEKVSTQITLSYQPLHDHAKKLQDGKYTSAHLVIYSGDEVLRKEYRRRNPDVHDTPVLKSLDCSFRNEENISEEVSYTMVSNWNNFLDACIDKTVIALVARDNCTEASVPLQDTLQDELIFQKTTGAEPTPSANNGTQPSGRWSVSPDVLVLNTSEERSARRLKIANYSDKMISFEFIWPAETLLIAPCKGKIPALGQLTVQVSAKAGCLSSDDLPWKGNIYIQCNNEQKCVGIEIHDDITISKSSIPPSNHMSGKSSVPPSNHMSQKSSATTSNHMSRKPSASPSNHKSGMSSIPCHMTKAAANDVSLIPHLSTGKDEVVQKHITFVPPILDFSATKIGCGSDLFLTIINNFSSICAWSLSPIAPPYCKSLDGKNGIARITYAAFVFSKQSGSLGGKGSIKVNVSFHPHGEGLYSQFWEIDARSEGRSPSKIRLEMNGEGSSPDVYSLGKRKNTSMDKKASDGSKHGAGIEKQITDNSYVFVKDTFLTFPQTSVGDKKTLNFRLCNKSNNVQKVRVSGFKPPFFVDYVILTIRPKNYVRVPVHFAPEEVNTISEGLIVISLENGGVTDVKLIGKSN